MNLYAYVDMPIEHKDKLYHICLPIGAPYIDCKEVLYEAIKNIDELIAQDEARQKQQKEESESTQQ